MPQIIKIHGRAFNQDVPREGGGIIVVVISLAISTMMFMFLQDRLSQTIKMVAADRRSMERQAIAEWVASRIDCKKSINFGGTTYSPSVLCPVGTSVRLQFMDAPNAEPEQANPGGFYLANGSGNAVENLKWFGKLSCGASSLNLSVKLWDSGSARVVGQESLAGGDRDGLTKICPSWFGGMPDSRIYSIGRHALQDVSITRDPNTNYLTYAHYRCDGAVGKLMDYYYDDTKCGPNGARAPFCDQSLRGAFQFRCGGVDPGTNISQMPAGLTRECSLPRSYAFIIGNASCEHFCLKQGYSVGRFTKCTSGSGHIAYTTAQPDVTDGEVNCLCLK